MLISRGLGAGGGIPDFFQAFWFCKALKYARILLFKGEGEGFFLEINFITKGYFVFKIVIASSYTVDSISFCF